MKLIDAKAHLDFMLTTKNTFTHWRVKKLAENEYFAMLF
jgi:hypothetical protein